MTDKPTTKLNIHTVEKADHRPTDNIQKDNINRDNQQRNDGKTNKRQKYGKLDTCSGQIYDRQTDKLAGGKDWPPVRQVFCWLLFS